MTEINTVWIQEETEALKQEETKISKQQKSSKWKLLSIFSFITIIIGIWGTILLFLDAKFISLKQENSSITCNTEWQLQNCDNHLWCCEAGEINRTRLFLGFIAIGFIVQMKEIIDTIIERYASKYMTEYINDRINERVERGFKNEIQNEVKEYDIQKDVDYEETSNTWDRTDNTKKVPFKYSNGKELLYKILKKEVKAEKNEDFSRTEVIDWAKSFFEKAYPNNSTIEFTLSRLLQDLRDMEYIEFLGNGKYKRNGKEWEDKKSFKKS